MGAELNFNFSLFTEESQKILRAVQRKYEDFHTFFTELTLLYEGQRMTAEQEKAGQTISLIEKVNMKINETLDVRKKPTKEELDILFNLIKEVDQNVKFFGKGPETLSKAMQKRVEEVEKSTEISLANLAKSSAIIKGRVPRLAKQPKKRGFLAETALKGIGNIGGEIARSALGPLAGVATAGVSIYKGYKQRRITKENEALSRGLLLESEVTPEGQRELYKDLFADSSKIPPKLTERAKTYPEISSEKGPMGLFGRRETLGRTGAAFGGVNLGAALFSFFNTEAYRAKWSFELLENIKKIADKKLGDQVTGISDGGGAGKGFLGGILGGLSTKIGTLLTGIVGAIRTGFAVVLPLLGQGVAVGAAGFAGWKAGRFLGENVKLGEKTLDERTQGAFEKGISWWRGKVIKSDPSQGASPEVKRALELQNQGMSIKEAASQAHEEFYNKEPLEQRKIDVGVESVVAPSGEKVTDRLNIPIEELNKTLGKLNSRLDEQKGAPTSSGNFLATSIGDPFIEALSVGSLDVE